MQNIGDDNREQNIISSNLKHTVKIYLGLTCDSNYELISKTGKWEDMQEMYFNVVENRSLKDELLAEVAMGHLDLDERWENNNYTIQMLDQDYNEMYRTTMFRPLM